MKKPSKTFNFAVEGETENAYLNWLRQLINNNTNFKYHVNFRIKKTLNVNDAIKTFTIMQNEEIYIIFDHEYDCNFNDFKKKVLTLKKNAKSRQIKPIFGCTNAAFELWIILHKTCFGKKSATKNDYLKEINLCYKVNFESLRDFKNAQNFQNLILSKLCYDDFLNALKNAETICNSILNDSKSNDDLIALKENPSTSLHKMFIDIIKKCK